MENDKQKKGKMYIIPLTVYDYKDAARPVYRT